MADFNRNNRFSRGGSRGGFKRGGFNDRPSRGPVEMHKAVCDQCGNECEVPFKPTQGKPIFCSNCFEKNRPSESPRSESSYRGDSRRSYSEEREMFQAVCDNCGKDCKIPFRPTSGRPVYCSNCFEKGDNEPKNNTQTPQKEPSFNQQFEQLNSKLDSILKILEPAVAEKPVEESMDEEKVDQPIEKKETAPKAAKKKKAPKKPKSSKQE